VGSSRLRHEKSRVVTEPMLVKVFAHLHWAHSQIMQACAAQRAAHRAAELQSASIGHMRSTAQHAPRAGRDAARPCGLGRWRGCPCVHPARTVPDANVLRTGRHRRTNGCYQAPSGPLTVAGRWAAHQRDTGCCGGVARQDWRHPEIVNHFLDTASIARPLMLLAFHYQD
jgi:hypothetical protein